MKVSHCFNQVKWLPALALLLMSSAALHAEVKISEFMAVNARSITDADGANSDWIEIQNTGPGSVDMAGYHLTDDPTNLSKWTFPARSVTQNAFLIVFASAKNRTPAAGELHANFSLDGAGEYLALVAPDGTTILQEFAPYPEQFEDVSYGASSGVLTETVVPEGANCRWTVPPTNIANWQTPAFNDSFWKLATTGIGYDRDTAQDYNPRIGANGNTEFDMYTKKTGVFIRVPFTISNGLPILASRLRIRYDDGFACYINDATLLASDGSPASPVWNSVATIALGFDDASYTFNLPTGTLLAGNNVLAIHGMNTSLASTDMLIMPALEIDFQIPFTNGYIPAPTPNAVNSESFSGGFVADTKFSVKRGFYDTPQTVEITTLTPGATIRYTTNGSEPSATNGTVYTAPLTISTTTALRAAAFKQDFIPTNVDTNTYIFAANVVSQPANVPGYPAQWGDVAADYQMDPSVTANADYSGIIQSALKTTLPVVCISASRDVMFNVDPESPTGDPFYSDDRSGAEMPISMEYFDPNSTDEFQQNAGVRMHGGNARSHPKKPMRLYFKNEYGKGKLDFPLFGDSSVKSFDQLILRPGGHDGWSVPFGNENTDLAPHAVYMRDQFIRRTELDMGMLSPRGKYVHVYINGLYWGIYDMHERANAQFFAAHKGGAEADWDVYHHPSFVGDAYTLVDGTANAYVDLQLTAVSGITNNASYQAMQEFLDIDGYIDAMISRIWVGDYDWDGPMTVDTGGIVSDAGYFTNKNWYCGRKSRNGAEKFIFFAWDAEMSMGTNLMQNRPFFGLPLPAGVGNPPQQRVTTFNSTKVGTFGGPAYPYAALRQYQPFKRRFGDRLQKHLFANGAMTTSANIARLTDMEQTLDLPIVAESARWGDVNRNIGFGAPFLTRNGNWRPEVEWLKNTFMAGRNATVIGQFRAIGLYPNVDAASFSTHGGPVNPGAPISLSAPTGNIWYTLDGSDPLVDAVFTTEMFVAENAAVKALVPTVANGGNALGGTWKGSPANSSFNDNTWKSGSQGVGYETSGTNYAPYFNVNVAEMSGVVQSAYVRYKFVINPFLVDLNSFTSLRMNVRYDDGFVAYLNGEEIARANAPFGIPTWDSGATTEHFDLAAEVYETYEVVNKLRGGTNILAFQMLNNVINSSDLLLQVTLEGIKQSVPAGPSATAIAYAGPISLNSTQTVNARVQDPVSGEWSALSQAQFLVGTLASAGNIVVSELNYRPREPISSTETAISTNRDDFEWIELMNISGSAVDITNMKFTQGIEFTFNQGGLLQPGEKVLVVRNRAAFLARYGAALDSQIAGEFENGTGLSNGGEQITLTDSQNVEIHSFTYDDISPWPSSPDDDGHSLELMVPLTNPDHKLAQNWTGSLDAGGTPGSFAISSYALWAAVYFDASDPNFASLSDPNGDFDGDGWTNFLEYALGTDPVSTDSPTGIQPLVLEVVAGPGGQHISFTYRQRPASGDFECVVETSANGRTWTNAATETATETNTDTSIKRTFRSNASFTSDGQQLMRVRANQVIP